MIPNDGPIYTSLCTPSAFLNTKHSTEYVEQFLPSSPFTTTLHGTKSTYHWPHHYWQLHSLHGTEFITCCTDSTLCTDGSAWCCTDYTLCTDGSAWCCTDSTLCTDGCCTDSALCTDGSAWCWTIYCNFYCDMLQLITVIITQCVTLNK